MFDNGSEIVRVDFHLHTRKDKEFSYSGEEHSFIGDYVAALKSNGIRVGVITNHNKFDYGEYKGIRDTAKREGIFILPGVELTVKEGSNGLHTLIIFDPATWLENGTDNISKFIDSVYPGIPNRENANTQCAKDVAGTLQALDAYGKDYFIIFAHVEQSKGILVECAGGLRATLAANQNFQRRVLALQKVRKRDNIPVIKQWLGHDIALVDGSDPKSIEDIGKQGGYSFVKLGEYSYSALKYALADHANRLFDTDGAPAHSYIKAISFVGGKLDQQRIGLSRQLNTLIGIRGSGKSSILEVLRYALSLEPSEDSGYKTELVEFVMGSGGKVTLHIVDEHGAEYTVKRIFNENPSVIGSNGKDLAIPVGSVLQNLLYFGQKDLAMSKPGYELSLLNKLVGNRVESQSSTIQEQVTTLADSIRRFIAISDIPGKIASLEEKEREYEHKLQVFKEKGITERLEKQTSCNEDAAKIVALIKETGAVLDAYDKFLLSCSTTDISLIGYSSKYNAAVFTRVQIVLDAISAHLAQATEVSDALGKDAEELKALQDELLAVLSSLKEEFAQVKREIDDDTIDLEGFEKYQKELLTAKDKLAKLRRESATESTIRADIKASLRKRNEILKSIFDEYSREIDKINESQSELLISISFKGDKACFEEQLRSVFKGTGLNDGNYKALCAAFSDLAAVVEDYFLDGGKKLRELMTARGYENVGKKIVDEYAGYIAKQCPNLVEIAYHGKPLSKHSMGQRASALMLFILSQEENDVIIIDQPEDDLDNQVVYTEFIRTIKKKKPDVQFIFATHNANIPVLGDAERVVATSYLDDRIAVYSGNIDADDAHKKIVDIMEGGYEAFQRRNAIYTSWEKH